jgi:hypothetical protein
MTYDEYASEVGKGLLEAHNNKNRVEIDRIFLEADKRLTASSSTEDRKRKFWASARQEFSRGRFRVEEQANSSLHALMQLIQTNLNARQGGK